MCLGPDDQGEGSTKFSCGSEDGELVYASWVLPEEENASYIESSFPAHYGPMVSLERSPFYKDVMLTVCRDTSLFFEADIKTESCIQPSCLADSQTVVSLERSPFYSAEM